VSKVLATASRSNRVGADPAVADTERLAESADDGDLGVTAHRRQRPVAKHRRDHQRTYGDAETDRRAWFAGHGGGQQVFEEHRDRAAGERDEEDSHRAFALGFALDQFGLDLGLVECVEWRAFQRVAGRGQPVAESAAWWLRLVDC